MELKLYPKANAVAKNFLFASLFGLLLLLADGLLIGLARVLPNYGLAETFSQIIFWRGRPIHLQLVIFAWLSMALMGAIFYVVPRMVKQDLYSSLLGHIHLALQWVGIVLIGLSLHYGFTEGREYLEPVIWLDLAVVIVWLLFASNIFATVFTSKAETVSYGLKFILVSILYLGLNFVLANFVPLSGVRDDLLIYTFAHNEVNGWFMFGLIGVMYYALPKLAGLQEKEVFSAKLSNWHFWLLMFLIPPSVLHHFLYQSVPINNFWKQTGQWGSVAMLAPTFIWVYLIYKVIASRKQTLGIAGGFYISAMVYYTLNCIQGAGQSVLPVNEVFHQTQWIAGHAHLALIGWISMGLFGVLYQFLPDLLKVKDTNKALAKAHLVLANVGFLGIWLSLSLAGIIQGANASLSYNYLEQIIAPYLSIRAVSGMIFTLGGLLLAVNFTVKLLGKEEVTYPDLAEIKVRLP